MSKISDQLKAKFNYIQNYKSNSPQASLLDSSAILDKIMSGKRSSQGSGSESPISQNSKANPFRKENKGPAFMPGHRSISPLQTEPDNLENVNTSLESKGAHKQNLDKSFIMKGKIKISPPRTVTSSTTVVIPVHHIRVKNKDSSQSPEVRVSEQLKHNQRLSPKNSPNQGGGQNKAHFSIGFKRASRKSNSSKGLDETTIQSDEESRVVEPMAGHTSKILKMKKAEEAKVGKLQDSRDNKPFFKVISLSKIKNSPSPSPPSHPVSQQEKKGQAKAQLAQDFIKGMIGKGKQQKEGHSKRFGVELQNLQQNQQRQKGSLYVNYAKDLGRRNSDNKENIESNGVQQPQKVLSRRDEGIKQQGKHLPQNHSPFSPGEQAEITLKQQNENQYMIKKIGTATVQDDSKEQAMFKFPFQRRARKDLSQSQEEDEHDLSQIVAQKLCRLQYKSNSPPHSSPFTGEEQKRNKPVVAKTNFVMAHHGLVRGVQREEADIEVFEQQQRREVEEWLMEPGGSQETADSQKLRQERVSRRQQEEAGLEEWMFKTFDPTKKKGGDSEKKQQLPEVLADMDELPTFAQRVDVGRCEEGKRVAAEQEAEESPFGLAQEVVAQEQRGKNRERDKSMCDEISSFMNQMDSLADQDNSCYL